MGENILRPLKGIKQVLKEQYENYSGDTSDYLWLVRDSATSTNPGTIYLNNKLYGGGVFEELNYSEFLTLYKNSQLKAGVYYRITDYVTTSIGAGLQSAMHPFDIVVLALSPNKISKNAYALEHEGDTYFSQRGEDLSAWELNYEPNLLPPLEPLPGVIEDVVTHGVYLFTHTVVPYYYEFVDFADTPYANNPNTPIKNEDSLLGLIYINNTYAIAKTNENDYPLDADGYDDTEYFEWCGTEMYNGVLCDKWIRTNSNSEDPNGKVYMLTEKLIEEKPLSELTNKGKITYMKDSFNNECYYDFKNILFNDNYTFISNIDYVEDISNLVSNIKNLTNTQFPYNRFYGINIANINISNYSHDNSIENCNNVKISNSSNNHINNSYNINIASSNGINIIHSNDITINQYCSNINISSTTNSTFNERCRNISLLLSHDITIKNYCDDINISSTTASTINESSKNITLTNTKNIFLGSNNRLLRIETSNDVVVGNNYNTLTSATESIWRHLNRVSIGNNCSMIKMDTSTSYLKLNDVIIGNNCNNIQISPFSNHTGNNINNIQIGDNSDYIYIYPQRCNNICIGRNCKSVTVWACIYSLSIGDYCQYIYLGQLNPNDAVVRENITINNRCYNIQLANNSKNITIGPSCHHINCENRLSGNISDIQIGAASYNITFPLNSQEIIIGSGCQGEDPANFVSYSGGTWQFIEMGDNCTFKFPSACNSICLGNSVNIDLKDIATRSGGTWTHIVAQDKSILKLSPVVTLLKLGHSSYFETSENVEQVNIGENSKIWNCVVNNSSIGNNCKLITASTITNSHVGNDIVQLNNCTLTNSVVSEKSKIVNISIIDSNISEKCTVQYLGTNKPTLYECDFGAGVYMELLSDNEVRTIRSADILPFSSISYRLTGDLTSENGGRFYLTENPLTDQVVKFDRVTLLNKMLTP